MTSQHTILKDVKLLALDMDGVLTDGRIFYGSHGDELKCFNIQDGLGIVLLRKYGIATVIITGKKSSVNRKRAKELKIKILCEAVRNKKTCLQRISKKLRIKPENICYVGDDLVDLEVMQWVGYPVAVANAVDSVKDAAMYTTHKSGGEGAVREVCDLILKGAEIIPSSSSNAQA